MQEVSKGVRGNLMKVILLMIFSIYTCSITFFTHSHIIGGVTIVHSHFHDVDENGKPTHEHSGHEIQLIQNLSTYFSFGAVILAILVGLLSVHITVLFVRPDCLYLQQPSQSHFRLRAPPVL